MTPLMRADRPVILARPVLAWWGGGMVAAGAVLAVVVVAFGNGPLGFDVFWHEWLGTRAGFLLGAAHVFDAVGGGWYAVVWIPLAVVVLLLAARRPWSAAYFALASVGSALAVQAGKHLLLRARPEEILVTADIGSFPSGHAANAATFAMALWIIVPRVWVAVAGAAWIVLMALSRTYVAAHWLSDTLGGALLGAGVALLVAIPLLPRVRAEADRWRRRGAAGAAPGPAGPDELLGADDPSGPDDPPDHPAAR